jgi:hypothetical protein
VAVVADPVSLTLGGVVAGLVAKAVDSAGDRVVAGAAGVLGRLVDRVRARFRERDDASGMQALERVVDAPDSPSRLTALAAAVDGQAVDDGFRAELEVLIAETQRSGVDVASVVQTAWGNQNVQIGGVTGSEIQVTYGSPQVPPPDRG